MDKSGRSLARVPKVFVGVACGNSDTPLEFERTLAQAQLGAGRMFHVERMNAIGYITDDARNDIVRVALEKDYDYVFFADMDMVFPAAAIVKMIEATAKIPATELPVVAGVYNSRKDYRIHAYKWLPDIGKFRSITSKEDGFKLDSGLMQVDAAGTGCMLIDCNVFKQLQWPWFEYKYEHNPDIGKRERWSEDIVFCHKLMNIGIHVYLHTGIVCGHIQRFQIKQTSDESYSIMEL